MKKIRLFMCCHKEYDTVPSMWEPIQCGAALNPTITNTLSDNAGENISLQNRIYCELTAHYYAWKNITAEYYGFSHYRRFLGVEHITKLPYIAIGKMTESKIDRFLGDESYWKEIITSNDIIAPRSEDMGLTVREHYITSAYHYEEDLVLFFDILGHQFPHLYQTAQEYLSQNRQYFCNMFIMKKELFHEYCEILFSVLSEFDNKKTLHGDFQSDRTDGYLGELFSGVYINYCYKNGAAIKELPRIDVNCSIGKRFNFALLPPESKRRFVVKRIVKKFRGK